MNLGAAIKELRKKKGLSQEELAKKAALTQATLSKIENGKRPNDQSLKSLCSALNVPESLIYLMGLEKTDVSDDKKDLYERLFPIIQAMVFQLAGE